MIANPIAVEIPFSPKPGEIWFYLELALIDDVPALYQLLESLSLKPQPAYIRKPWGVEVMLLLAHEKRTELLAPPDDYYLHEQQTLADAINCEAMHCAFSRTEYPATVAA